MATFLSNFLTTLQPPPQLTTAQYDGLQYKWNIFVFRPALFKIEAYLLAGVAAYIAFTLYGITINSNKVNKWFSLHRPILEQQFSNPLGRIGLTQDGYTDYYNFSTGRRNVTSLHTVFTLQPRHDFFQWAFHFARTLVDLYYRPKDDITLDFRLAPRALAQDFVWAIVAKDELLSIKDDRWDLTFTKTSENPALPPSLSVMSEFADVTDNLLKSTLISALSDSKVLPYFRSLSVTDQPRSRPDTPLDPSERHKRVVLCLSVPSPRHAADTVALVSAIFPFIDSLPQLSLRPETRTKLKKTRDDLEKTIKAESEKEKKEEAAEDKKATKRKAEEERIAKLSAAEQKKNLDRERKRMLRKTQGKLVRK